MNALYRALRPVRRRIRMRRAARAGGWALCLAAAWPLGVRAASFLTPIERQAPLSAPGLALGLAGVAIAALWPVPKQRAAAAADAAGLKQRALTALELGGDASPMAQLQREDAAAALRGLDERAAMPLPRGRAALIAAAACAAVWVALSFLPNPQLGALAERTALRDQLHERAEQVEKAAEALQNGDAQTEELKRLARQLSASLRQSQTARDALLALNEAGDAIRKIERQQIDASVAQADQALSAGGLDALREALKRGDSAALAAAAQELAGGDSAALSGALSAAAQAAPAGGALASALAAAAAAAPGAAQSAALNQLAQRLAQAASSASASTLNALVASARAALGGGMGNASAQGSGQGSGNAAGGGAGLGGQGQQGFGSGAGMGHTTRDAGYAEGSARRTGTGGAGAPVDKTGVYQSIYDPTRLGDGGEISQSTGGVGEGDMARADLAPGLGQAGDAVPYAQNAYQYARSAANAAGAPGVPDDVRDRVNRYFDALIDESEG